MRISVIYDDERPQRANDRRQQLCSIDLYINTRDDLVRAQAIINGLLNILPAMEPVT